MSQDFEALRTDVDEEIETFDEEEIHSPFNFLDGFYTRLDEFLIDVLISLKGICSDDKFRPADKVEDAKTLIYEELQRVRECREALHSTDIPTELYFLLEDIKNDFEIELDIGLEAEYKILISSLNNRFRMLQQIAFWNVGENTDAQVISFPRSELRRPLSYSLLVHECLHTKQDLIDKVGDKLQSLDENIDQNKLEEVCVDLLALNYMGPVYGLMIARIPNKIGEHESSEHPTRQTRMKYVQQYLEYIEKSDTTSPEDGIPTQQTLSPKENFPFYKKLEENAKEEIEKRRNQGSEGFELQNFDEIQEHIQIIFEEEGIPSYETEKKEIRQYLGMPEASIQTVSKKLDKFLLDNPNGREIALPIKPILLFNLLLAVTDYGQKPMQEVVLSSFKKWYVTRRTRQEMSEVT